MQHTILVVDAVALILHRLITDHTGVCALVHIPCRIRLWISLAVQLQPFVELADVFQEALQAICAARLSFQLQRS